MTKGMFHARVWSKLLRHLAERELLADGDGIVVALSGGADSVCLADFLHRLSQRRRLRLHLMHVHHGLRGPEADRDAVFCHDLARRLGLPITIAYVDVPSEAAARKGGTEAAARRLRYAELARRARELGFRKVATAHHLDDQAETFLLQLLRGTNAAGLAGISVKRPLAKNVEVIRPLLTITRADVLAYLRRHRLSYRSDSSNTKMNFTRNWVRRKLLPLLERKSPRIKEHLAGLARQLGEKR